MPAPALIPREILFGNPVKAAPRLSPDGKRLSYLAPSEQGVLNVWLRTLGREDAVQLTDDRKRGIRSHGWAHDGSHVLFVQDSAGDENWHVHSVDIETRQVRDLTPFQGVRAEGLMLDREHPQQLLVGLNLRDRRVFDIYRIDLVSGAVQLDTENPGDVLGWLADAEFIIRGALAQDATDASRVLRVRDDATAEWRELCRWPFGETGGGLGFTRDGRRLFVESSLGSDTTRLLIVDATSGETLEEVAHDPRCDLGSVMAHPEEHVIEAVRFHHERPEWRVIDQRLAEDFERLSQLTPGSFSVTSRDHADRQWTVACERDDGPLAWYLYDRGEEKAEKLFVNRPELETVGLRPRRPVRIGTRGRSQLVCSLTLPGSPGQGPVPLVCSFPGGPWARDYWGLDNEAQWLANRGYAALQVNYRGSTGFGKTFLNAGNGEWGVGAMQHDLSDAVRWAIEQGVADPDRICIYGGSYGGYAALAGLCFTPELYRCGVDIVGPSNIRTLFESVPPYWLPMKRQLELRVGEVQKDEELNRRISPLFHADRIRVPLIIAQGANDPRVNEREAEQMVRAMRERGLEVTYVLYPDEGHGFARPENRLDFYGRVEEFLAEQLGGRAEPWTEVKGATAELR